MSLQKIVIAITGASGSIYAKVLFDKLAAQKKLLERVGVVMSDNAKDVWKYELNNEQYNTYPFQFYDKQDFFAPFASGSAGYDAMVICPCSAGTLGRIANGISNDLTTRAADVMLKERRKLILVLRETPYNLIHIRNMEKLMEAGGIICPASPSFYSHPETFEELAGTVINRVLDLLGLAAGGYKWGGEAGA